MLLPRIIDDEKGISHAGNQILSVNYGLVRAESVNTVSIQWGLVPEAYANFGYLGVGALAVVLAAFYSYIARLTIGGPLTSLRFVIGLLIMAAAATADTMGVFVTTQFQGVMAVSIASLFFMKRQMNPFAEEQEAWSGEQGASAGRAVGRYGGVSVKGMRQGARSGERGVGSGEQGARGAQATESGMPVPGVLAGLIEGSVRRGTGSSTMVPSTSGKTAMRATAWMPRALRMRIITEQREQAAVAAARADGSPRRPNGEESEQTGGRKQETGEKQNRPRQVAVPYRNYRRYRGA
jgi:hypothetical protein